MDPFEYLTERQYTWARRHGIEIVEENGYVVHINDNLFLPLTPHAFQQIFHGQLPQPGHRIYAAHSSMALVVNVFFYWQLYGQFEPIIGAICPNVVDYQAQSLVFENGCPIHWPNEPPGYGHPPQLDLIVRYHRGNESGISRAIAVESKYREPYEGGVHQGEFVNAYVAPANEALWTGLQPLQEAAHQIHGGELLFHRLHVAQLIKHILGLNSQFHDPENFELVYLWYPAPGPEAVLHEEEIKRFEQMTDACDPPVKFRAIKYHDLIYSLARSHGNAHGAYIDYLLERYF